MRTDRRHWTIAFLVAIGLHAGVAVAMLWQKPDSGAVSAGIGGIEIDLGLAGGAPGSVASAAVEAESEDVTPEEALTEPPPPETAEPPPDATTAEPVEPVETVIAEPTEVPVEAVETAPVVEVTPAIEDEPPVEEARVREPIMLADITPPDRIVAKPVVSPAPPKRKPRPPEPPRAEPMPEPAMDNPPEMVLPAKPPEKQVVAVAPSAPGAGGKAGTQDSANAGSSSADANAGGMAGAEADYGAILLAWLERHKEYPHRAQRRRQEGTVLLYIVVGQDGTVLDSRVEKSSGYGLLDRATIDMLKRAEPLPPMPRDMGKDRLEVVVPVHFFIT